MLFIALAFNGVAAAAAQAQDQPRIVPFRTAHVRYDMTLQGAGEELRFQGEGDIDAARNAGRLTLQIPGVASTEIITIDGRAYIRDPNSNQWIYSDAATAGRGMGISGDNAVPDLSLFSFVRVGSETVGGAPTTHWRADVDFAELAGQLGLGPEEAAQLEEVGLVGTLDVWVGNNDSYLHRYAANFQSSIPDPQTGRATTFTIAITVTFSNFNAPVQITAPANAVPAPASSAAASGGTGRGGTGQSQPAMPRTGGGGLATGSASTEPEALGTVESLAGAARGTSITIAAAVGMVVVLVATTGLIFGRRRRYTSR
ncbi:MAG: hypothetical protein M3Q65_13040 [Chloroflexota bacterium]|nr:hypothetical protein [Chloroflexota bacterium]